MVPLWKDYAYCCVLFYQLLTIVTNQQGNACCNALVLITSEIPPLFDVSKYAHLSTTLSRLGSFAFKIAVGPRNLGLMGNAYWLVPITPMQIPQLLYVLAPVLSDISHRPISVYLDAPMVMQILSLRCV